MAKATNVIPFPVQRVSGVELMERVDARLRRIRRKSSSAAEDRIFGCPSSGNLRLVRRFAKGGSGSSGLEFRRPAADAASVGLR
jgi:hypothetical protein